ncbi:hypothetical protein FXO37_10729 [Capsicum annuum]|nr:hypothetical protein FXO37_10729 [Capsicum annuum]
MTNKRQMQDAATIVGATSISSTSRANSPQPMAPVEKPRKFTSIDFKRWQQKMFFYLTTLCIQRFTSEDAPEVPEGTSDKERFIIVEAWKYLAFLCLIVNDTFQVAGIIEKLPPMWKDFKNYLKYKHKEIIVEDLIVRLHIEEDNKAAERRSKGNSTINGAHIVEDDQNNSKKRNKSLGSKWIFKRKTKTDNTIDKYKARLVVKGFKQKEGLDYFDIYSPVTRITLIQTLVVVYDLEIHQMDVKTIFLNRELEEVIYMEQPEGFVVPGKKNKVCKLIKSLYGLKQEPKQWHTKFDQTMLANGFKINEYDKCVYIKDTPNHQVIVCLYVDDVLIISRDMSDINAMKQMLESKFDMKDLGVADLILGIRILRNPQGLALSQSYYIENVLEKFKYMKFDIAKTPLDVSFVLQKNEGESDSY